MRTVRCQLAAVLAVTATALTACSATMSKDECRTVDWRTVGYEDGVAGRSGERIGEHRKACAEHGVTPDLNAYRAGRAEGLREYCQPHNGYRAGVNGAPYYDSCPPELAPAFVAAYESGRELYVRERRVADADSAIAYRRREIARLESKVADRALTAINENATPRSGPTQCSTPSTPPSASGSSSPRWPSSSATVPATSRSSRRTAPPLPRCPDQLRQTASTLLPSGSTRNDA